MELAFDGGSGIDGGGVAWCGNGFIARRHQRWWVTQPAPPAAGGRAVGASTGGAASRDFDPDGNAAAAAAGGGVRGSASHGLYLGGWLLELERGDLGVGTGTMDVSAFPGGAVDAGALGSSPGPGRIGCVDIGAEGRHPQIMRKSLRTTISIVVCAALVGGVGIWRSRARSLHKSEFREAEIRRGDLILTITATGTVEPEEVVDVGAQVAGRVNLFGKDRNGKTDRLRGRWWTRGRCWRRSTIRSTRRMWRWRRRSWIRIGRGRRGARRTWNSRRRNWRRRRRIGTGRKRWGLRKRWRPTAFDSYRANFAIAKANVSLSEAALKQARAATAQAQATLERQKQTLDYCTIVSPVKGVIIDRAVNIGQTVVSSLNAPSLFLIAKDLTRMQVWVSVNEADIGAFIRGRRCRSRATRFERGFRGDGGEGAAERDDDAECCHLYGGGEHGQFERAAAAVFDGEREIPDGGAA